MKSNGEKVVAWRQRTKAMAVIYKGGACLVCGYHRHVGALTFHHIDPKTKKFGISGHVRAWVSIKAELDKCVLVCQNCHTEIHGGFIHLAPYLVKNPSPSDGDRMLAMAGLAPRGHRVAKTCVRCGASIQPTSTRCRSCAGRLHPTKILWPDPEALDQAVRATSLSAVGRQLGVSNKAVAKRLARYPPRILPLS